MNSCTTQLPRPDLATQAIENNPEPIIGRTYEVPVAFQAKHFGSSGEWIPIIGPLHEDTAIIGFPEDHWHIDWRFASASLLKASSFNRFNSPHARVATVKRTANQPVQRRRLRCKRLMPEFPGAARWMDRLEAMFADRHMTGFLCPHKGMPLTGCPVNDGIVICPGHGLAWRIENGQLVRRAKPFAHPAQFPPAAASAITA